MSNITRDYTTHGAKLIFISDCINSVMPCGFRDCDSCMFFKDWITLDHLQCVNLICMGCHHSSSVSVKNYYLMQNIENYILIQAMEHKINYNKESIRREIIQRGFTEDMK